MSYPTGTWVIPMDQEFAEGARQILDVQKYPDLRESPDGPLEQPYDAAGWTLQYQMGVALTPSMTALTDEARGKMKRLGSDLSLTAAPTPYQATSDRCGRLRQPSRVGLRQQFDRGRHRASPRQGAGSGPVLIVDPAQNNSFRAINRAWKSNAIDAGWSAAREVLGRDTRSPA